MRLTKAQKNDLLHALLNKAFKDRDAALDKRKRAIGDDVYAHVYTGEQQRAMALLPPGTLAESNQIFNFLMSKTRRVGCDSEYCYGQPDTKKISQELADKYAEFGRDEIALIAERGKLYEQIAGALAPITTDKKLYEVWPEVTDVAVALLGKPASNLPAVIPTSLNAAIGLP